MNRLHYLLALAVAGATLAGCNLISNGGGGSGISIVASTGQLQNSGGGSYTYNAGSVPQYGTEAIVFIFSNNETSPFTSTGTVAFTNNDFSAAVGSSFTIPAGGTATLDASFTPSTTGTETGTLTLASSNGSTIVVNLQGEGDTNCVVTSTATPPDFTPGQPFEVTSSPVTFTMNSNTSTSVTLTGAPNYVVVSPNPYFAQSGTPSNIGFSLMKVPISQIVITDSSTSPTGTIATVTFHGFDNVSGALFSFSFQVQDEIPSAPPT